MVENCGDEKRRSENGLSTVWMWMSMATVRLWIETWGNWVSDAITDLVSSSRLILCDHINLTYICML